MTLKLGCIADDYTGASDLANTLTRAGLRTAQTIGVPADDLALPEVDAVVVSLKSRSIEASLAVSKSRAAETWLRGRGARHVLFKICSTFDSTDKGNIGPVMDALREDCGETIVLVTPAFPETGRTVYQGNLFVGTVPLNESPLKDHPLNPMHDSNLVRVSSTAAAMAPVGGLAAVLAGSCSQATLGQIAAAEKIMPVLHLDSEQVVQGKDEARRALAWARERLQSGPLLIASSATPERVAALQARHGRDATGHAIEETMADIAEALVQAGVRRLIVAGGETSGAVVDRLQIPGFLVGEEIAAGVPVLRAVGARQGGMLLALKSGNFGGPAFFADALALMR